MKKDRHRFIRHLFAEMQPLNYIWLEIESADPNNLSSTADLNFLIPKKQFQSILQIVKQFHEGGLKYSAVKTCDGRSIIIKFNDGSFLRINLLTRVTEKGWILIDNVDLIGKSSTNESGVRTLCADQYFEIHFLKASIKQVDMPKLVIEIFKQKNFESRSKVFGHVSYKYRLIIHKLEELYEHNRYHRKSIISHLRKMRSNRTILRMILRSNCGIIQSKYALKCHTLVLVFSGENTQAIEHVQEILQNNYKAKPVVMGLHAYKILKRIPLGNRKLSYNTVIIRLYIYVRYLLFNYTILINSNNDLSSSSGEESSLGDDSIRVFIQDIKETKNKGHHGSYSNDIFHRLGINPQNYSLIVFDHIKIDHHDELIMKESVRAN